MADALDKGVRGALDWITSREWSFANLRKGLSDLWGVLVGYRDQLLGLFAFKDKNGFHMGPLVQVVVGAFQWAARRRSRGAFSNVLWVRVGDGLASTLLNAVAGVGPEA